jgi:hypothetical protein
MTDIATRYMRLVEKRPELEPKDFMSRPVRYLPNEGWVYDEAYHPREGNISECIASKSHIISDEAYALIVFHWLDMLPTGVVLHHNKDWPEAKDREGNNAARGNWWVQYIVKRSEQLKDWPGACGATPIKALLAFWEGQL